MKAMMGHFGELYSDSDASATRFETRDDSISRPNVTKEDFYSDTQYFFEPTNDNDSEESVTKQLELEASTAMVQKTTVSEAIKTATAKPPMSNTKKVLGVAGGIAALLYFTKG